MDEWSASWPSRFTSRETASGIHWIGGLVGLRAGMDAGEKRINPCRELYLVRSARKLSHYIDWTTSTAFTFFWDMKHLRKYKGNKQYLNIQCD
jgi:hypothetical protein